MCTYNETKCSVALSAVVSLTSCYLRLLHYGQLAVTLDVGGSLQARQVACGYGFTVLLCRGEGGEDVVYGTGINTDSQLGYHEYPRKSGEYKSSPASLVSTRVPLHVW